MINQRVKYTAYSCISYHLRTPFQLILLCALLLSHPLHASQRNNKEDLIQLRNRIQELQKDLASKEVAQTDAADTLRKSEKAISDANRKLARLKQEKQTADISFNQLQTQSQQILTKIKEAQEQLGKLLHQQYLSGPHDYLRPLLNQQNPSQAARKLYYFGHLTRARTRNIDTLRSHLDELEKLTRISHEKQKEITANLAEQAKQNKWLKAEKIKRSDLISQIAKQIDQQQHEIKKLKHDEARLSVLANQINKLVSPKNTVALYNNKLPVASKEKRSFASLKGQLNLPVRGELVSRFGSPRSGKNITWKGLLIRSASGSNIKAIAAGQVVFSDWLRGFGNLMIIDHGSNYMSLYGNNETIYKQVGDIIQGGDTIATVGNSGGNLDSGLYFELRHRGKPFDPLTWIKIE